ncbi:methyltransferase domain protein [Ceratobasidium sp. AG-Ba]|nr:methyltransferase domain protein [Ceratobasidium sp. AG-Ba]
MTRFLFESIRFLFTEPRAQEMATEFPHCDITSVDIAPIATHAPRPNIAFEVYDLYAGVAEEDESFDYISCRHVQLAVKEYDRLLFDLHRVLRPGGLISICEVDSRLYEVDSPPYTTPISTCLPNLARGIDLIRRGIVNQGIDLEAIYRVGEWMRPGTWRQLEGMLAADGLGEDEAQKLSMACIEDLQRANEQGIRSLGKYWIWWGFKPGGDGREVKRHQEASAD